MLVTAGLRQDHQLIRAVLECLDILAGCAEIDGALDTNLAREVLAFMTGFVDRVHHRVEERELFPALERCAVPSEVGSLTRLRVEHDRARAAIAAMHAALDCLRDAEPCAAERFAICARAYTEIVREHMAKEERVVFPIADRVLGDDFEHCAERVGGARHGSTRARQRYSDLARSLCERMNVAWAPACDPRVLRSRPGAPAAVKQRRTG